MSIDCPEDIINNRFKCQCSCRVSDTNTTHKTRTCLHAPNKKIQKYARLRFNRFQRIVSFTKLILTRRMVHKNKSRFQKRDVIEDLKDLIDYCAQWKVQEKPPIIKVECLFGLNADSCNDYILSLPLVFVSLLNHTWILVCLLTLFV